MIMMKQIRAAAMFLLASATLLPTTAAAEKKRGLRSPGRKQADLDGFSAEELANCCEFEKECDDTLCAYECVQWNEDETECIDAEKVCPPASCHYVCVETPPCNNEVITTETTFVEEGNMLRNGDGSVSPSSSLMLSCLAPRTSS